MKQENRQLRTPGELRAVSHPVRLGILELLFVRGPLTATDLGDALDESPANCSWHLRKLAEHGLVEEAGGGRGRQRPWQATHLGLTWPDDEAESQEEAIAGTALARMISQRWLDRFHASAMRMREDDPAWAGTRTLTHTSTWLTPEEMREVQEALEAVTARFRDRILDPESRPEQARLCEVVGFAAPVRIGEG